MFRGVAQLVARLLWEQEVPGSNPGTPTKKSRVSRGAGSPLRSDKSRHPDFFQAVIVRGAFSAKVPGFLYEDFAIPAPRPAKRNTAI